MTRSKPCLHQIHTKEKKRKKRKGSHSQHLPHTNRPSYTLLHESEPRERASPRRMNHRFSLSTSSRSEERTVTNIQTSPPTNVILLQGDRRGGSRTESHNLHSQNLKHGVEMLCFRIKKPSRSLSRVSDV